ncbi:hypothetical protein WDW37_13165 [Bdellovibrionota bacterium FG-1]
MNASFWQGLIQLLCMAAVMNSGLALFMPHRANATVRVELHTVGGQSPGVLLGWSARHQWKWITAPPSVSVLYSQVILTPPSPVRVVGVQGGAVRWERGGSGIQLLLSALQDRVIIEQQGGPNLVFDLRITLSSSEIISHGCDPYSLQLLPQRAEAKPKALSVRPIPVGLSCSKKTEDLLVTVTVPEDVEWADTSLFEVLGKGERWKQYSLTSTQLSTGGNMGRLNFAYGGSVSSYLLQIRQKTFRGIGPQTVVKAPVPPPPPLNPVVVFRGGLGVMQASVSTPFTQGAAVQPDLDLGVRTRRFFKLLDLGARIKLSFPVAMTGQAMTLYGMQFYLSGNLDLGSFLTLSPRVYFVSMGGFYDSGAVSLQLNQPGFGLFAQLNVSARTAFLLGAVSTGLFPNSTSQSLEPEVGIEFPFLGSKADILLGYSKYIFGGASAASPTASLVQTTVNVVYLF